jgi:hypothetical protein
MLAINRVTKSPTQLLRRRLRANGPTQEGPGRRPSPHGPQMHPGDPVRESGIYEVTHGRDHRPAHEVVMLKGTEFPLCDSCDEKVRFRLVRTAPYIFQDGDFEEQD